MQRARVVSSLRIPMRGYETNARLEQLAEATRYESPCGVMRIELPPVTGFSVVTLRIPMRGYERLQIDRQTCC